MIFFFVKKKNICLSKESNPMERLLRPPSSKVTPQHPVVPGLDALELIDSSNGAPITFTGCPRGMHVSVGERQERCPRIVLISTV